MNKATVDESGSSDNISKLVLQPSAPPFVPLKDQQTDQDQDQDTLKVNSGVTFSCRGSIMSAMIVPVFVSHSDQPLK